MIQSANSEFAYTWSAANYGFQMIPDEAATETRPGLVLALATAAVRATT